MLSELLDALSATKLTFSWDKCQRTLFASPRRHGAPLVQRPPLVLPQATLLPTDNAVVLGLLLGPRRRATIPSHTDVEGVVEQKEGTHKSPPARCRAAQVLACRLRAVAPLGQSCLAPLQMHYEGYFYGHVEYAETSFGLSEVRGRKVVRMGHQSHTPCQSANFEA